VLCSSMVAERSVVGGGVGGVDVVERVELHGGLVAVLLVVEVLHKWHAGCRAISSVVGCIRRRGVIVCGVCLLVRSRSTQGYRWDRRWSVCGVVCIHMRHRHRHSRWHRHRHSRRLRWANRCSCVGSRHRRADAVQC
jgi:hypothetical protein